MIVDPPALPEPEKRHQAVQGTIKPECAGMSRLQPGGILFHVFPVRLGGSGALFYNTAVAAALESEKYAGHSHAPACRSPPTTRVSLFIRKGLI